MQAYVRFGSLADICSAKGHVRFAPNSDRERGFSQKGHVALPLKADMCAALAHVCFGPNAEVTPLFDHLVGQHEEVVWHFDPERPRGGEIDDEMEFGRLLDWEIAGLGPAQNLVHILGGAPE